MGVLYASNDMNEVRITCSLCIICSVVSSPIPPKLAHVHKAAYVHENTGLVDI